MINFETFVVPEMLKRGISRIRPMHLSQPPLYVSTCISATSLPAPRGREEQTVRSSGRPKKNTSLDEERLVKAACSHCTARRIRGLRTSARRTTNNAYWRHETAPVAARACAREPSRESQCPRRFRSAASEPGEQVFDTRRMAPASSFPYNYIPLFCILLGNVRPSKKSEEKSIVWRRFYLTNLSLLIHLLVKRRVCYLLDARDLPTFQALFVLDKLENQSSLKKRRLKNFSVSEKICSRNFVSILLKFCFRNKYNELFAILLHNHTYHFFRKVVINNEFNNQWIINFI